MATILFHSCLFSWYLVRLRFSLLYWREKKNAVRSNFKVNKNMRISKSRVLTWLIFESLRSLVSLIFSTQLVVVRRILEFFAPSLYSFALGNQTIVSGALQYRWRNSLRKYDTKIVNIWFSKWPWKIPPRELNFQRLDGRENKMKNQFYDLSEFKNRDRIIHVKLNSFNTYERWLMIIDWQERVKYYENLFQQLPLRWLVSKTLPSNRELSDTTTWNTGE